LVAHNSRAWADNAALMFRRNRFSDLITRQLDIFGDENAELLAEIAEYRDRWRRASRTGAEEAFGDEQDRVDWAAEALSELCDSYAATLAPPTEAEYRRAFTKAVRRRLPALADVFEAETDTGQ
jgi:hypothetical protein